MQRRLDVDRIRPSILVARNVHQNDYNYWPIRRIKSVPTLRLFEQNFKERIPVFAWYMDMACFFQTLSS